MRNSLLIVTFLLVLISGSARSQTLMNTAYTFKIDGAPTNTEFQLAYHLGNKQYVKASAKTDENAELTFYEDSVHVGLYMLVFPDKSYFELIINEPSFTITTEFENPKQHLKVIGSRENDAFFDYVSFIGEKRKEAMRLESSTELTREEKSVSGQAIDEAVEFKRNAIIKKMPESLVAKLIRATMEIEVPSPSNDISEQEASREQLVYYREHFFDNIDLSTSALLYTSVLDAKLMTYINQLTVQVPDSLIVAVDELIEKVGGDPELKRYTVMRMLNYFATLNAICMDKVYLHIVEKYYLSGVASWADADQLERMRKSADELRNNICGIQAPPFSLINVDGTTTQLQSIDAKWTVLLLNKANCSNCETTIKELNTYSTEELGDFKILWVSVGGSQEAWSGGGQEVEQ